MSSKWARVAKTFGIIALLLGSHSTLLAEFRHMVSVRSQGEIWIMPPLNGTWQKIGPQPISEGSLMRLGTESSIELKQEGEGLDRVEVEARLRISAPLIFRIDRQLFKKITYDDYVLNGIWNEGSKEEKSIDVHPLLSFSSAFIRYFLALDTDQKLPKLKADPDKPKIEAGELTSNLTVLSPSQDSFQELDRPRISLPVFWQSPSDELSYKIYLWPAQDVKREALATVKSNRYQLTLDKPGNYRLQIASTDHRFRSEIVRIIVDRPIAYKLTSEPLEEVFKKAELRIDRNLIITYPPAHFEINSAEPTPQLLVSWHDRDALVAGEVYTLVIQGEGPRDLQEIKTTESFLRLPIRPGSYRYFIKKHRPTLLKSGRATLSHDLRVVRRSRLDPWSIQWLVNQTASRDHTILIENH